MSVHEQELQEIGMNTSSKKKSLNAHNFFNFNDNIGMLYLLVPLGNLNGGHLTLLSIHLT